MLSYSLTSSRSRVLMSRVNVVWFVSTSSEIIHVERVPVSCPVIEAAVNDGVRSLGACLISKARAESR